MNTSARKAAEAVEEQRVLSANLPSPSPSPEQTAKAMAAKAARLVLVFLDKAEADKGVDLGMMVLAATAAQRIAARQHAERGGDVNHLNVSLMAGQAFADQVEADSRRGRVPVGTILDEMAEVRS